MFRTGGRKKTSPYERLGVPVPANLSLVAQLLQLTPEQLRPLLSGRSRWLHEKVPEQFPTLRQIAEQREKLAGDF